MLLQKLLLGITLAAPIGPVSIEMIQRGLRDGFWGAFNIRLGGAIGNSLCLVAAFLGLSAIQSHPTLITIIGCFGSILLLYMAYCNCKKACQPISVPCRNNNTQPTKSRDYLKKSLLLGFSLAIFNPVGLVFWLGIFANDIDPNTPLTFFQLSTNFVIIIGVLMWGAGLSGFLALSRQAVNPTLLRFITFLSGIVLLYFAITTGYKSLALFFPV